MDELPESSASAFAPTTPTVESTGRPRINGWLIGISLMGIAAATWLSYETWRFFLDPTPLTKKHLSPGAIDLYSRFTEVNAWFTTGRVYFGMHEAMHPPATFALLWPLLGILSWTWTKIVWFALSLVGLCWLSRQMIEHSLARTRLQRTFVGLMPFASYAAGAALGNGQLIPLVLPILLYVVLHLSRPVAAEGNRPWLASAAMLWALVQPTIAAPFFWLVLLVTDKKRYGITIAVCYLVLTLVSSYCSADSMLSKKPPFRGTNVLQRWTDKATKGAYHGSRLGGYGSVHDLLAETTWEPAQVQAVSLLLLATLGAWVYAHRHVDLWLLIGITALLARFWTYHRWYDDLLLMLPLVSLFRVTQLPRYGTRAQRIALGLFLVVWGFSLAPGVLYTVPVLVPLQVTTWLVVVVFLLYLSNRDRLVQASPAPVVA